MSVCLSVSRRTYLGTSNSTRPQHPALRSMYMHGGSASRPRVRRGEKQIQFSTYPHAIPPLPPCIADQLGSVLPSPLTRPPSAQSEALPASTEVCGREAKAAGVGKWLRLRFICADGRLAGVRGACALLCYATDKWVSYAPVGALQSCSRKQSKGEHNDRTCTVYPDSLLNAWNRAVQPSTTADERTPSKKNAK
jgi:hypothetical protein